MHEIYYPTSRKGDGIINNTYTNVSIANSINCLNNSLFVVENLDLFKKKLKKKGFTAFYDNKKATRALINESEAFLSDIETDFLSHL